MNNIDLLKIKNELKEELKKDFLIKPRSKQDVTLSKEEILKKNRDYHREYQKVYRLKQKNKEDIETILDDYTGSKYTTFKKIDSFKDKIDKIIKNSFLNENDNLILYYASTEDQLNERFKREILSTSYSKDIQKILKYEGNTYKLHIRKGVNILPIDYSRFARSSHSEEEEVILIMKNVKIKKIGSIEFEITL
jgi:hypothetical protein